MRISRHSTSSSSSPVLAGAAGLMIALAGTLPAQLQCMETHAGEPINTSTVTGGPNLLMGLKLTANFKTATELVGAQVLTGLRTGPGTMDIWSHDAANDRPLASLTGAGSYTQTDMIAWQGATFPNSVIVQPNQVFWLVWGMPDGSRTPWSTATTGTVEYRGSFDNGQTWNGQNNGQNPWPAKPYKIRLFQKHPTTLPVTSVGTGKPGDGQIVPQSRILGWPTPGNEIGLLLEQAATGVPAVLALGLPGNMPIPGLGTLYVTPQIVLPLTTSGSSVKPSPGRGAAIVPLQLQPSWVGYPLSVQWWILDPQAQGGLSHSQGSQTVLQ